MIKSPAFFVGIGMVLMLAAIVTTYIVWGTVQDVLEQSKEDQTVLESATEPASATISTETAAPEQVSEVVSEPVPSGEQERAATSESISASDLPLTEGQRATADTFGIDLDAVVITPAVQICAETKLGSARYQAILNGDTPGFSESLQLLSCLEL